MLSNVINAEQFAQCDLERENNKRGWAYGILPLLSNWVHYN